MDESEGGWDGAGRSIGEVEDGEEETFGNDNNEKSKTKTLLEFLTQAILLQILIPEDESPPKYVLCKQAWSTERDTEVPPAFISIDLNWQSTAKQSSSGICKH